MTERVFNESFDLSFRQPPADGNCSPCIPLISRSASAILTRALLPPHPAQLVEQLAIGKCLAVAKQHPDAVVIGCDTVVDVDGTVFGKPHDAEDAKRMLRALSGKTHQVHTGVCIAKGDRAEHFVDSCKVTFLPAGGGGDRVLYHHIGTLR